MLLAAIRKEFEISMMLPGSCAGKVYAIGEVDGIGPCIVMDCIDGGPLYLDNLRLPGHTPTIYVCGKISGVQLKVVLYPNCGEPSVGGIYAKGGF